MKNAILEKSKNATKVIFLSILRNNRSFFRNFNKCWVLFYFGQFSLFDFEEIWFVANRKKRPVRSNSCGLIRCFLTTVLFLWHFQEGVLSIVYIVYYCLSYIIYYSLSAYYCLSYIIYCSLSAYYCLLFILYFLLSILYWLLSIFLIIFSSFKINDIFVSRYYNESEVKEFFELLID